MGRKKQKTKETEAEAGSPEPATKQMRGRKSKAAQVEEAAGTSTKDRTPTPTPTLPTRKSPRRQPEPKKVARKNLGKGAKNTVPVTATVTESPSESQESKEGEYQPPSSVRFDTEGSDTESPVKKVRQSREEASQGKKGTKPLPSDSESEVELVRAPVKPSAKSPARSPGSQRRVKKDYTFAPEVEVEIAPWLQAHPHLWNTKDENYRNTPMCQQTWEEGAERFNCSGKYILLVNLVFLHVSLPKQCIKIHDL